MGPAGASGAGGQALLKGAGRLRGTQRPGHGQSWEGKGGTSPGLVSWARGCVYVLCPVLGPHCWAAPHTRPRRCPSTRHASLTAVQRAACLWPLRSCDSSLGMPLPLPGVRAGLSLGWDPGPAFRVLPDWPRCSRTQVGTSSEAHRGQGQGQVREQGLREPGGGISGDSKIEAPWGDWTRPRNRDVASVSARGPGPACPGWGEGGSGPFPCSPCASPPLDSEHTCLPRPRPGSDTVGLRSCGGTCRHGRVRGDHPSGSRDTPLRDWLAVHPTGSPLAHIPPPTRTDYGLDSGGGRWQEVAPDSGRKRRG